MKAARQSLILSIIESTTIETQEDLAEELEKRNQRVTQATISRDIKELRLVKTLDTSGKYRYAVSERQTINLADRFNRVFSETVISIDIAVNLIVIKTINASANAAAEAIDSMNWTEILGTVAGDNTILVVVKDNEMAKNVLAKFNKMINYKE